MRSVFLQSNKDIFSIEKIDTAKYAASLGLYWRGGVCSHCYCSHVSSGLATVPTIKFAKKSDTKNKSRSESTTKSKKGKGKEKDESSDDDGDDENIANSEDEDSEDEAIEKEQQSRIDKLFKRKNAGVLSAVRNSTLSVDDIIDYHLLPTPFPVSFEVA